jgi:hypothetical protein
VQALQNILLGQKYIFFCKYLITLVGRKLSKVDCRLAIPSLNSHICFLLVSPVFDRRVLIACPSYIILQRRHDAYQVSDCTSSRVYYDVT